MLSTISKQEIVIYTTCALRTAHCCHAHACCAHCSVLSLILYRRSTVDGAPGGFKARVFTTDVSHKHR